MFNNNQVLSSSILSNNKILTTYMTDTPRPSPGPQRRCKNTLQGEGLSAWHWGQTRPISWDPIKSQGRWQVKCLIRLFASFQWETWTKIVIDSGCKGTGQSNLQKKGHHEITSTVTGFQFRGGSCKPKQWWGQEAVCSVLNECIYLFVYVYNPISCIYMNSNVILYSHVVCCTYS